MVTLRLDDAGPAKKSDHSKMLYDWFEAYKRNGCLSTRIAAEQVGAEDPEEFGRLAKRHFAEQIEELCEDTAMGPEEAMALLSRWARNEASEYWARINPDDEADQRVILRTADMVRDGKASLIVSAKTDAGGRQTVEFVDPLRCLHTIIDIHGLKRNPTDIRNMSDEALAAEVAKIHKKLNATSSNTP